MSPLLETKAEILRRKTEESILTPGVILHLTYGLQVRNRVRAESFHSHLNADIQTPHPNIYVFVQSLTRQQASTHILTGSLAFTRAPSRARIVRKLHNSYSILQTIRAASLISSATFGVLDIALPLSVFA